MTTTPIPKPKVTVGQEFTTTSANVPAGASPVLITGACFEVVEAIDSAQTVDPDAKVGSYSQLPIELTESELPTLHDNADEIEVIPSSVEMYLLQGGQVRQLSDSGFLVSANYARKAGLQNGTGVTQAELDTLAGRIFTFCLDNPTPANVTTDITVTFDDPASTHYTPDEVCEQINEAAGAEVMTYVEDGADWIFTLASTRYGALSSVLVRAGSTGSSSSYANEKLHFGYDTDTTAMMNQFVTGAGFYGSDDGDGDTLTPWVTFSRGNYYEGDLTEANPVVSDCDACSVWYDLDGNEYTDRAAALDFTELQLAVGDYMYADASRVNNAEIAEIETSRIRLGNLTTGTRYDSDGDPVYRVYADSEVNMLTALSSPWSPRYAYFIANNLLAEDAGTEATLTSKVKADAAEPAVVQADNAPVTGSLSGLFLRFVAYNQGEVYQTSNIYIDDDADDARVATIATFLADYLPDGFSAREATTLRATIEGAEGVFVDPIVGGYAGNDKFKYTTDGGETWSDEYTLPAVGGPAARADMLDAFNAYDNLWHGHVYFDYDADTLMIHSWEEGEMFGVMISTAGTLFAGVGTDPAYGESRLELLTDLTGSDIRLTVLSTGTANYSLGYSQTANTSAVGVDAKITSRAAELRVGVTLPLTGADTLAFALAHNPSASTYVSGTATYTASGAIESFDALKTDVEGAHWIISGAHDWAVFGNYATATAERGADGAIYVVITAAGTSLGTTANRTMSKLTLGAVTAQFGTDYWAGAKARGISLVSDPAPFKVTIDNADDVDMINMTTVSVPTIVSTVNAQLGYTALSYSDTTQYFTIVSPTKGLASSLSIPFGTETISYSHLFFDVSAAIPDEAMTDTGSGRPDPDFYIDDARLMHIAANIMRNAYTGYVMHRASSDYYVTYKALRLDVTRLATNPGLITWDMTQIQTYLDPITTDNPFGLGMYLASFAAGGQAVSGIGVEAVSTAYPFGTPEAFSAAFDFLQDYKDEVYTIVPISQTESVMDALVTHVHYMADEPSRQAERIGIISGEYPEREQDTLLVSGTQLNMTAVNTVTLETNPQAYLVAAGIDVTEDIPLTTDLYIEFSVGSAQRVYKIQHVSGVVCTVNPDLPSTVDTSFYSTDPLTETVVDADWTIGIRGAELEVAGVVDKDTLAETAAGQSSDIAYRRIIFPFCGDVAIQLASGNVVVPNQYAAAIIGGMIQLYSPQQPLTNLAVPGLTAVYGTSRYLQEDHMDTIAGGGRMILIQETSGGSVTIRHQLTTDVTSVATRECSTTRAVDRFAKTLRAAIKPVIGRTLIEDKSTMQSILTAFSSARSLGIRSGWIYNAVLDNLETPTDEPDTVDIEVTVTTKNPTNYVRITLRV